MAALMGRTQVHLKKIDSSRASVPDNPKAKLMYYLNCIAYCIEIDDDSTMRRLRNFENYSSLSDEEEAKLLILILALSPDELIGKILFPADDSDFQCGNEFFELSAVSTKLVVAESIVIGGQQKRVRKIMMFKKSWLENNYLNALRSYQRAQRPRRPPPRDPDCVIS